VSAQSFLLPGEASATPNAKALNIYPNPTSGKFTLQLSNLKSAQTTVEILSENGVVISRKAVGAPGAASTIRMDFDLTPQPAGVYLIKVVGTDGVKTGKVVVQR
jgi:hypothetical protein